MSQQDNITVRDEKPQQDNSDKTADEMNHPASHNSATGQEASELRQGEEPSGYRGENPANSGMGGTRVTSDTPENASGRLNPSAPADTGTTVANTPE